ncbi:MAG: amidohydrolase [Chloroflexi bacterium HGW-Chloroflexi-10]|nr:MAG: amidohydrolase [Chloroflexi bacterium HGW-Chloroflexi-10]
MGTILIENGTIVTLNDLEEIYSPGYVFIENDTIVDIASGEAPSQYLRADTVINANLMAVIPGLVNAHTHLFQTFIRGLADDKPLLDWLKTAIWPVAQVMTEEETYLAAMVGLIENLRGGATSVIDHQYIHADPRNDDGVCRAADETGIRFLLARGWADMDYHPALMETPERIVSETIRLRDRWQIAGNGRTRVEYGPLIPWGCSDETMSHTHEMSRNWCSGTHIHVAETKTEVDMNIALRGNRHIEWLAELGMLGPDMQLVHSVWLSDAEIDLIAKYKAIVVHCPVSNMYLASGVARVPEMLEKGITVALASDGPGSNNNQDMLAVLKTTALLHKVNSLNAMVLLPEDVLRMACRGGAAAFGLPDQIGSLQPGKKADIVLIDLDTPMAMPVHHVPSALIYNVSTRDVDTVIVDGRILMRDKSIVVVDEKTILAKARKVCDDLFTRAGIKVD